MFKIMSPRPKTHGVCVLQQWEYHYNKVEARIELALFYFHNSRQQ